MRQPLLYQQNLARKLKQLLLLFSLLLLPSTVWGENIIKTYYLSSINNNGKIVGVTNDGNTCEWEITASGTENSANDEYGFQSTQVSSLNGGGSLIITSEAIFGSVKKVSIDIGAGDYLVSPEYSTVTVSACNVNAQDVGVTTVSAYTGNPGNIERDDHNFTITDDFGYVSVEVSVAGTVDVLIRSITVEYVESYGLLIAGTEVTSNNATNITGDNITLGTDGKVSFTPGEGSTPGTLTLNNATIEGDIISQALTINLVGNNTISGKIHPSGYDVSEGELAFTGTENSSLTINASVGSAAIYNYTSVNFGSYKLTTSTSPGVYYNSDYHNLWTDHIGDGNSASNVTLTTKTVYPLWIGNSTYTFTQVTEDNKSKILGDSKISFDGNNTLTLSEATLVGSIISGLSGGLTIVVDKENFINMTNTAAGDSILTRIRNIASNASLTIKKSNNEGNCSLVVNGPIKDFSSISYENGIYLSSAKDGQENDLNPAFIYYNYSGGFQYTDNSTIKSLTFSTTEPEESIWIGDTQVGENGRFEGIDDVEFDKGTNTLTLSAASISMNTNIVSSLPNLTINLTFNEENNYGMSILNDGCRIISSNPSATLTFTTEDGRGSLSATIDNSNDFPWKGFSGNPTFEDKLVFTQTAGSEYIKVLSAPTMSYTDNELTLSGLSDENTQFSYYYAITYADNEGNISKTKKTLTRVEPNPPTNSDDITITHTPFTVEASVVYTDCFGNTTESDIATGKYFGFAEKMKLVTLASNTEEKELVLPEILPSIGENDGITFVYESDDVNIIYKNADSKWMIKDYGGTWVSASITGTTPFTVLNEAAELYVNVLHDPTFEAYYGDDETNVYNGKGTGNVSVEISCSDLSQPDMDDYKLMCYSGTDKTEAEAYEETLSLISTTTVNAFIRYTNPDTEEYFDSEPVSNTYTVIQQLDIPSFEGSMVFQTYYSSRYSLQIPNGLKAYIITGISEDKHSVVATAIEYIPKGKAILLEKNGDMPEGGYVAETYTGEEGDFSGNMLFYVDDNFTSINTSGNEYVLYNNEFIKATGTIAQGKCYLGLNGEVTSGIQPHSRGFSIDTNGGGTSGINEVISEGVNSEKWADGECYDLQGRRIQKPAKAGLYIVNGKKMVINNK